MHYSSSMSEQVDGFDVMSPEYAGKAGLQPSRKRIIL
jgi:hypothetical protein